MQIHGQKETDYMRNFDVKMVLELLQPWKTMIDNGMTTFGETDINPRSEYHAWSASPCFDFLHIVAGIYPSEAGFKSVIIEPNFRYLNTIDVEMPHPQGMIIVHLTKSKKGKVSGEVFLPKSLKGTFVFEDRKVVLHGGSQKIKGK